MIRGPAGVGKTAMVRQFALAAETDGSCFIFGKADPRDSRTPLAPVTVALDMMVKKFIANHSTDMTDLARTLSRALGRHLGLLISLVPALEFLIADTAKLPLSKRVDDDPSFFYHLLYTLIEHVGKRLNGLVIFIDDIQWLDPASHGFLAYWAVAQPLPRILLIMGLRDGEKWENPPLAGTLSLYQGMASCRQLPLKGLPKRDIHTWMKTRLGGDRHFSPLSDLCFDKTQGNPFYLAQMVEDLLERGLVRQSKGEWVYDPEAINRLTICENVADLVISRIRLLREDALILLKHGACIREDISPKTLSATTRWPKEKIKALLWESLDLNFLEEKDGKYTFTHDKILEAVEGLISPEEKIDIHRCLVAFYLSGEGGESGAAVSVFTLLHHYEFCRDNVTDTALQKVMVRHYFDAGQQARANGAYAQALDWFRQGLGHYPEDIWQSDYDQALAFCQSRAHCAYLSGDFERAGKVFEEIDARASCYEDRLDSELVKLSCLKAKGEFEQARVKGIEILGNLGVQVPVNPSRLRIRTAILKTWARLALAGPLSGSGKKMPARGRIRQIVRVMNALLGTSYALSPTQFLPYIIALALGLTLRHGSSPETPSLYISFGIILNKVTGSVKWGRKLSAEAREISRALGQDSLNGQEMLQAHCFLDHWDLPIQETVAACEQGQEICLRHGDHEYFGYHALMYVHVLLFSGIGLSEIIPKLIRLKQVLNRLNHRYKKRILYSLAAFENLRQGRPRPWDLSMADENPLWANDLGFTFDRTFYRFCAAFFSGHLDVAFEIKPELDSIIHEVEGTPCHSFYWFMAALVEISAGQTPGAQHHALKALKGCAANNPGFYGPKYLIAQGEYFRTKKHLERADTLFAAAGKALEKTPDALYEKGLVHEKRGWIARHQNRKPDAEKLFKKAEALYRRWGLSAKPGLFEADKALAGKAENLSQTTIPPTGKSPDRAGPTNPLEQALLTLVHVCDARSVHAATRDGLYWKTKVQATAKGIDRPAAFSDLPGQMLSFAGTVGTLVRATAKDSEEDFFDTAYFFKHHPTSLMVIPGGNHKGIVVENPKKEPDMAVLMDLAGQVFRNLSTEGTFEQPSSELDTRYLERMKSCCDKLQAHMHRHKSYKNPDLNLATLAGSMNISQRVITDAVNICLKQNLQTFINSHRIEAVKAEIQRPENLTKTVLDIAFEQGFNSKSTFNRCFKKMAGMTPSDYRLKMLESERDMGKAPL